MKRTFSMLLLLLLGLPITPLVGQIKGVGLPFIVNHPRSVYNASTQNWAIAQSSNGFMYFGNNDGILQFDGTSWTVFPVPNASVVRSLMAVGDTLYAGAFEEIGYLAPDASGQLQWKSLNHLIPHQFAGFDEVWSIFRNQNQIIFQSFSYIFILQNNNVKVIEPRTAFSFMHQVNDRFYVVERDKGLMVMQNDTLSLVSSHPVFFRNEIMSVLPLAPGQLLIGTSNEGLFILEEDRLSPWQAPVSPLLEQHNLFSAALLRDGNLAFGSISNGVYITDKQGRVLQHLNRIKGLQNNTVLALFQDRRNNLWLGLDNGIDFVEISSPISLLNHIFHIESAYASIVHNNRVYVGTNQGLFVAPLSGMQNLSEPRHGFSLIKGTEGQVWSLQVIGNTLFCGHNYGCFIIEENNATQISDIRGFWSFLQNPAHPSQIIAGTYTGLVLLKKNQGQWLFDTEVEGFRESSRHMYIDYQQNIWVSHGYRGLFKLKPHNNFRKIQEVTLLRHQKGLPADLPYNIQLFNGRMVLTTHNGILYYNDTENVFTPHPELTQLFENKGFIDKIHQDTHGNIWYFTDHYIGLMRLLEDGTYRDITAPFSRINDFLLPAFQNIYIHNPGNIFIGSQKGLIHYNASIINDYNIAEPVFFREVAFYGNQQLQQFFPTYREKHPQLTPQLPFALNSVTFRFTSPVFENPAAIRFAWRLKGFDNEWSDWDQLNFKEYTNLREGNYVFEVKALNAFGVESPVAIFPFSVAPPWHRSLVAYIIYTILLVVIIAGNVYFVRKRMLRIRQREKIRHEKRLAQREKLFREQSALSEKEIMHLRNEALRSEMSYKNKELANATLHLIQKNKTLTSLKTDLSKLLRNVPAENNEKQLINNLLKKVNKDLRNEKSWELFNNYFDEVHQDFINRLKEQYSDLSPKELRLCAYLRMNISSKEIAPLMNISVRGVEISRYRLRKKLKLDHNTNLTEFIMTF